MRQVEGVLDVGGGHRLAAPEEPEGGEDEGDDPQAGRGPRDGVGHTARETGSRASPRRTTLGLYSTVSLSIVTDEKRWATPANAACPSRRARGAPMQWWMPNPKDRWRLSGRVRSSAPGRSNTSGSRLAAPRSRKGEAPASMTTPAISTSSTATRPSSCTGGS